MFSASRVEAVHFSYISQNCNFIQFNFRDSDHLAWLDTLLIMKKIFCTQKCQCPYLDLEVAHLVVALPYKRKVTLSIPDGVAGIFRRLKPYGRTGVNSASNRNENQVYVLEGQGGRCVGLTTLPFRNSGSLYLPSP